MRNDARRLKPSAVVVDVGEGADGADDCVGRWRDERGLLDEGREGVAEAGVAAAEKSRGVGVAIDGGVVGDAVVGGNAVGAAPTEKVVVDCGAGGVAADAALAAVPGERRARRAAAIC